MAKALLLSASGLLVALLVVLDIKIKLAPERISAEAQARWVYRKSLGKREIDITELRRRYRRSTWMSAAALIVGWVVTAVAILFI